jgi:hypothetical protein
MSPLRRVDQEGDTLLALVREGTALPESNRSADPRPKTGQRLKGTALLLSAQFLVESDKLTGQSISICANRKGFLDGFTADVTAIGSPGVVGTLELAP